MQLAASEAMAFLRAMRKLLGTYRVTVKDSEGVWKKVKAVERPALSVVQSWLRSFVESPGVHSQDLPRLRACGVAWRRVGSLADARLAQPASFLSLLSHSRRAAATQSIFRRDALSLLYFYFLPRPSVCSVWVLHTWTFWSFGRLWEDMQQTHLQAVRG
jgi:hypothetical protein